MHCMEAMHWRGERIATSRRCDEPNVMHWVDCYAVHAVESASRRRREVVSIALHGYAGYTMQCIGDMHCHGTMH